jgi:two-component system chemotaxis response regulator CheY
MRVLIVEDDFVSRKFMAKLLSEYGSVDVVVDGLEALDAYLLAMKDNQPYDLICLDIMMPKVDGVKVLKAIRDYETSKGMLPEKRVKVIMTTALQESQMVKQSFEIGCEAFASKPINVNQFLEVMRNLKLI